MSVAQPQVKFVKKELRVTNKSCKWVPTAQHLTLFRLLTGARHHVTVLYEL
jgi:hypothetical protein